MSASVVLITGALTGIGRATALAFARDGARLIVSGRRDELGRAIAREPGEAGVAHDLQHPGAGIAPTVAVEEPESACATLPWTICDDSRTMRGLLQKKVRSVYR